MLDDLKLMRVVNSEQESIAAMMQGFVNRTHGSDRILVDDARGRVAFYRGDVLRWTPHAELIGIFMTDIERWRWWWVMPGMETFAGKRLDAAYSVGQREGIETLTARNPAVSTEKDAALLARVCASLAGAQGVHAERGFDRVTYYALFADDVVAVAPPVSQPTPQHNSVLFPAPPPASTQSVRPQVLRLDGASPAAGLFRSPLMSLIPGPRPSYRPAADTPASIPHIPRDAAPRVPARELVRSVTQQVHALVLQHLPDGFRQAVMVLYIEPRDGKLCFSALVVAADSRGDLAVIDPSAELMQAVQTLVAEDARSGNARWSRLTIQLTSTPTGASTDVRVKR